MKAKWFVLAVALIAGTVLADENGIAWDELSAEQQTVLTPFRDGWSTLEPARQQRMAAGADRWSSMSPGERRAAKERFRKVRDLLARRLAHLCEGDRP